MSMIETKVPKDIRVYETKLIGPLSLRKAVCVLISLVFGFISAKIISSFQLPMEFTFYAVVFLSVPALAFGWLRPSGQNLENYLRDVLIRYFFVSATRKPQNSITKIKRAELPEKEKRKRKKELKKLMKTTKEYTPYQ